MIKLVSVTHESPECHQRLFNDLNKELHDIENSYVPAEMQIEFVEFATRDDFYANFEDKFLISLDDEFVGFVTFDYNVDFITIIDIFVIEKFRCKGIGQFTLIEVQNYVKKELKFASGKKLPLVLSVKSNNISAKKFYSRLGFKPYCENMFVDRDLEKADEIG